MAVLDESSITPRTMPVVKLLKTPKPIRKPAKNEITAPATAADDARALFSHLSPSSLPINRFLFLEYV